MGDVEDRALIEAIGDVEELERALSTGGSPDARDGDARSALEVAIEADDVASVRVLIAAGANVNAATAEGWTPLHMAVDHEGDSALQNGLPLDLRHIQPLLDAGADPTAEWTGGSTSCRTPLDMARSNGHIPAVDAMRRAFGQRDDCK